MKVLITGGLGYIGSHTAVAFMEAGYEVVIADNLSNSSLSVLEGITEITGKTPKFHKMDLRDGLEVTKLFDQHKDLIGVIHFAASKAVGESVQKPLLYYENNLGSLINVLQEMRKRNLSNFIFSSSCTVYGEADKLPITESTPIKQALSPYGNTKIIGEQIIEDLCAIKDDFSAISLRYFNPIGAHSTAKIGELPLGVPQNLIPYITQTAIGKRKELAVFGDDYDTPDGTCIRDYIHVMDLAEAHLKAFERLNNHEAEANYEVFNVGTGSGNSVMEIIKAFEKATGVDLAYRIAKRRPGDVTAAYADTTKANQVLGWSAKRNLETALASAWNWEEYYAQKNNQIK